MFFHQKSKVRSLEERYRRLKIKFRILLVIFLITLISSSYYLYLNYDYLVFKHLITQHYIYQDTLDLLYKNRLKRDVKGKYYTYFDNIVMSIVTEEIRSLNNDKYTYQYLPEQYARSKESEKEEAADNILEELSNDIVYVKLCNFSDYTTDFIKDNLETLKKHNNLIIDLRGNPGGLINSQYYIADLFLPKDLVIARDITRTKLFSKVVKSEKEQTLKYDHIVILQDEHSASSSEGLIAALHDNLEEVTLMGTTTFGKGIGQVTLPLRKGFAVKATTMLWNTPNNENIQGNGIEPDIHYTGDHEIEDAIDFIKNSIQ